MTTVQKLKQLVLTGESDQIEFKKKVSHPEKIVREMVAFANAKGGILLIGVDDDKNIIGVKDPDEEMEALNKSLLDLVKPEIKFVAEQIQVTRKRKVVYYSIKESRNKPHFVNPAIGSKNGIAYIRYNDKSIQASHELLEIIRKQKRFKKGFMFRYGNVEEQVMKKFVEERLTMTDLQKSTGFSKTDVSKALVNLVLANVLEIEPRDGEDVYYTKQS